MAREFGRSDRVADFLRSELARLIQLEMRDPRVGMVSVTAVDVTRDLGLAKVYVTVVGKETEEEAEETVEALNNAAGYLRSQIAKTNTMRSTPKIRFYFDNSVHRGAHMTALIDTLVPAASDDTE